MVTTSKSMHREVQIKRDLITKIPKINFKLNYPFNNLLDGHV